MEQKEDCMKIKTGTKLFAGLGVILVMVVAMAAVFSFSMKNVETTKKDVLQMAELDTFFSERVVDHLKWMDGLSSGLFLQGKEFQGKLDPDECSLGKWIQSFKPYSKEIEEPFQKIIGPHRQLHEAAVKVISNVREGHKEKAQEIFVSEIVPAVAAVQENLNKMKTILKKDEDTENSHSKDSNQTSQYYEYGACNIYNFFWHNRRHTIRKRDKQRDHKTA